jgi:hypothetical protein
MPVLVMEMVVLALKECNPQPLIQLLLQVALVQLV